MQTDFGLLVPVIQVRGEYGYALLEPVRNYYLNYCECIQNADKKGLSTIAEEVKILADKAKKNSLKPADYEVNCQCT